LLKSTKTKNILYETAMNSGIAAEFQRYENFNNILTCFNKS